MYEYEKFLVRAFSRMEPHFQKPGNSDDDIEQCEKMGLRYLEMSCSHVYGFPAEIHDTSKENSISAEMIPAILDSAIILDALLEVDNIDSGMISHLGSVIQENRQKSGFFNYFLKVDDALTKMFPDDLDNTSVCMLSLFKGKYLSAEECGSTAEKMLNHLKINPAGKLYPWFQIDDEKHSGKFDKCFSEETRMDVGATANILTFLATFDLDADPRVLPVVKFVSENIDKLEEHCVESEKTRGLIYYSNKFVIYFLLSRYVHCSKIARQKFGRRLCELVKQELLQFEFQEDSKALDIACIILSALHLELHSKDDMKLPNLSEDLEIIQEKLVKLVGYLPSLQNSDGSFDPWTLYHLNGIGEYACSKAIVTALVASAISKVKKEVIRKNEA